MPDFDLQYHTDSSRQGSFRLLELPPELLQLIESSVDNNLTLTIKGSPEDDAVLCTDDTTYAIRSVVLSNSVLVVAPPDGARSSDAIVIQDALSEVLEIQPTVPRLHRLNRLLRGMEWDEGREDVADEDGVAGRKGASRRYTYAQAQSELQASEHELKRAIRERHILLIDGALRPLAPAYLLAILELLLTCLVSLSQNHASASVDGLARALQEHDVRHEVSVQVMAWFGEVDGDRWKMDVQRVVTQVGLGILRHHKYETIPEDEFLRKWRSAVGDTFAGDASLSLLCGNYLTSTSPFTDVPQLTYFPCAELPTDPGARFADLFLTRPRWNADDIAPFLSDIVVDTKSRDKLLLKYARAQTDKEGTWYTARAR